MPHEESPIERLFHQTWRERVPQIQLIPEYAVLGGRYHLDFAYPPAKIAIELDGYDFHTSRDQFTHDRRRGRDLDRAGWRVLHFSGREINQDVVRCVNEVRHAIESARPAADQPIPARNQAIRWVASPPAQRRRLRWSIALGVAFPLVLLLAYVSLGLVWTDRIAPPTISQGDTARAARDGRVTSQPAQLAQSATALAPSPVPTAGALPSTAVLPATGAVTPSAAVATPLATLPTQPSLPSGVVINGGNLRTAPRVAANTVIGQVCPGDTLFLLEQNNQGWYRIRITTLAANCHPQRVAAETEGWLSSTLVRLQEL
jgi:very-short-patch-repair endonuclease